MRLSRLEQWLETTHASHSQNQMKNSCSLEPGQETSAHSKLRIRCLFSPNQYVLKVSRVSKLLPMIKSVLVVVMVKLFCSMLTKTSANLSCKLNYMEVFKV